MKRPSLAVLALSAAVTVAAALIVDSATANRGGEGGRGDGPVVFVRGQNLFYDPVVTADPLPPVGPFQDLEMGAGGLETDLGPGDKGYVGGRWREDFDGDGVFHYFLCPLLPPGREAP